MLREIARFFALLVESLRSGGLGRGLRDVLAAIWRLLRRLLSFERRPARGGDDCCLELSDVYRRADPLIYAQYYLRSMGLATTWDNPDIELFEPGPGGFDSLGAAVASSQLEPAHAYRVRVRVWNGSYDAPAVGLPVHLSYLSFGAGTKSHAVGTTFIDLGVKGSAQHPAHAYFDWRTPEQGGHFCLQARLDWSDDANPNNNLGQENVDVGVAHSPATFSFALRNEAAVRREFVLEADVYQLPTLEPCGESAREDRLAFPSRLAESRARWSKALEQQAAGKFPVPDDWKLSITPAELVLDADEERDIAVSVEVPDHAAAQGPVLNVNAFALRRPAERDFVGGVTFYIEKG